MSNNNNRSQRSLSSPVSKAKSGKKASFRKRSETAPLWNDVPAQSVYALVCACTTSNAPPTFGYTRDGTALTVAIYYDGERYVDYLSGPEEFDEYLQWVLNDLLNLSEQERLDLLQGTL